MDQVTKTISKADDPHYKTPLEFAKWRVNELKKPQQSGIINETIDTVIQLVSGILGQYNNGDTDGRGDYGGVFKTVISEPVNETGWKWWFIKFFAIPLAIITFGFNIIRWVISFFTSSLYQAEWFVTIFGNIGRVIVPLIIYVTLFGVTFGSESNYNTYRLLALLLLYIISYTELKYLGFMFIFLGSIAFETWCLFFKTNENQNE